MTAREICIPARISLVFECVIRLLPHGTPEDEMRRTSVRLSQGGAFLLLACLATARAQEAPWQLAVTGARVDYDLSGVGNAPGLAVRLTRDISSDVSVEFGGLFAKPDQQFGSSTLFIPEALVRYGWRFGRIAPYVGGGLGAALVKSSFHSDWDPTMAVAAGTSVRLTDRFSIVGEFRLRGHEWRATGTTTEIAAGIPWRFGARSHAKEQVAREFEDLPRHDQTQLLSLPEC